jgi:hypothetical protein
VEKIAGKKWKNKLLLITHEKTSENSRSSEEPLLAAMVEARHATTWWQLQILSSHIMRNC